MTYTVQKEPFPNTQIIVGRGTNGDLIVTAENVDDVREYDRWLRRDIC